MAEYHLQGFWADIILLVTPFAAAFGVAVVATFIFRVVFSYASWLPALVRSVLLLSLVNHLSPMLGFFLFLDFQ